MNKLKQNNRWADKAAEKIAGAGIHLQSKFASTMNQQFGLLSPGRLKIYLIFFCIGWGGLSIYFISAAVLGNDRAQPVYKVDAIKRPHVIEPTAKEMLVPMVNEATYEQIQAFKHSDLYDSTLRSRPGLADSILLLEQIYQSQHK